MTEETRAKLSAATTRNWNDPRFRKKVLPKLKKSKEHKKKISEALRNHAFTEARREKMRAAAKARWADPEKRQTILAAQSAKPRTSKWRRRLIASNKARVWTDESRKKVGESVKRTKGDKATPFTKGLK